MQLFGTREAALSAASLFYASLLTVSGENAGEHTAMYSAPSVPGVEYFTHSPAPTITADPAFTSIVPLFEVTRKLPLSTIVYSSNNGVCPGSSQPEGLVILAMLTVCV